MTRDRVRCVECREPISADSRICPHCKAVQPSPLIDVGVVVIGVFCILLGLPLSMATTRARLFGFALLVVGVGMAVGGYTRYLDRQAERRSR